MLCEPVLCAEGMVYLLDDWGMGEAQLLNQHNVNQYHLSVEHDDDEVSLLPLNSQVRIFHFILV